MQAVSRLWFTICVFLALSLPGCSVTSRPYTYDGGYDVLSVGDIRINESMAFPLSMSTEVRRRYVLNGLEKGTWYLVHISYLGSPSIKYTIHVRRVHKSLVESNGNNNDMLPETDRTPGRRKLADVAMLHMRTRTDEILFDFIDGDGDVDNGNTDDEAKEEYMPMMEIRGLRNGFPFEPDKWRLFFYNLRLEKVGGTTGMNRLVICYVGLVTTVVVAAVLLVPKIIANIAGDAPMPTRPRKDFLVFFIDHNCA